jgi:hypothetical protein
MTGAVRKAKPPVKGYLVDKHGTVHETHDFYDKDPKRAIAHLNTTVLVTTEGKYCYTLDPADLSCFDAAKK